MLSKGHNSFELPHDWIYRGEGNCNVVISLPKSKEILRIRKIDRPKTIIGWLITWLSDFFYWYSGKSYKDEIRDLRFYTKIMRPLLGNKYVSEAKQVNLSRNQINSLGKQLNKHRPNFRTNKILQYGRATLFNDFAYLQQLDFPLKLCDNTFAVEIKPKQGWRPFREKCFPKCLFCMNQYLKKEKGQVHKISKYCPEDLFSGNKHKMMNSVNALIETPQNNFKIFKNGEPFYGDSISLKFSTFITQFFENENEKFESLKEEFCDLIQKCLVMSLLDKDPNNCKDNYFCEWNKLIQDCNLEYELPIGCILEKILSVQMLDSEGSHYYYKLLGKEQLKDWNYIRKLLKEIRKYPDTCLKCAIMMLGNKKFGAEGIELVYAPYLISAVAKDLSIMLTFGKIKEKLGDDWTPMKNVVKTKYGCFVVNIGVFDLYPKPLSTVKKHFTRNTNIFEAYLKAKSGLE